MLNLDIRKKVGEGPLIWVSEDLQPPHLTSFFPTIPNFGDLESIVYNLFALSNHHKVKGLFLPMDWDLF